MIDLASLLRLGSSVCCWVPALMCGPVYLKETHEQHRGRHDHCGAACTLKDLAIYLALQDRLTLSILLWRLALTCELVPLRGSQEQLRGRPSAAVQPCTLGDITVALDHIAIGLASKI